MPDYLTTADTSRECRTPYAWFWKAVRMVGPIENVHLGIGWNHEPIVFQGKAPREIRRIDGRVPVNPSPRALDVGHCVVPLSLARAQWNRCRTHVARRTYLTASR